MPIIHIQRSLRQVGRIRIGHQVRTQSGKLAPAKLDRFRLSSPQREPIELAAQLWGGQPQPMTNEMSNDRWEIITEVDSLPVIIPPSNHFDAWMELWSKAGCERRCNGETMIVAAGRAADKPCECDPDNRECKPTTRLFVVLPDLQALGVWRLETHGHYAAAELAGAVELCSSATARGIALPARLELEARTRRTREADGKPVTRQFAVPVLSVDVSLPQARAILGGLDVSTGEIQRPAAGAIAAAVERPLPEAARAAARGQGRPQAEVFAEMDAERAKRATAVLEAGEQQALPPPPPATIPAPRTHEQYEQASKPPPAKPAENSKGHNWHRSVAVLVPDENERRALIWLASAGRTDSANDAKPAERTKAHDYARAIHDGGCALDMSDAGGIRMVALIDPDGNDIQRHEQPVEIS